MTADIDLINLEKLVPYLEAQIPDFCAPVAVEKFATGQSNPTFRLDTQNASYVLRRKPPGKLLKSAHAIEREFQVLRALRETAVPVPRTFVFCEDAAVIGAPFYIMSHVSGRSFIDPIVPDLRQDAAQRAKLYDRMNAVLAAIHSVDIKAAGLSTFGKPGNYYARQLDRWTQQYKASAASGNDDMNALIRWLEVNTPDDDGRASLVHGDYRIDNMLFAKTDCEVLSVLDWELATLGHPFSDLAYQCMQWRMPHDAPLQGLENVERAPLGIPSEDDYVTAYCERMSFDVPSNWPFFLAFNFFRLAAILTGVESRALRGNASNPTQALRLGKMVPLLVERGLDVID